jgi:hypothetical protein
VLKAAVTPCGPTKPFSEKENAGLSDEEMGEEKENVPKKQSEMVW